MGRGWQDRNQNATHELTHSLISGNKLFNVIKKWFREAGNINGERVVLTLINDN